MISEFQKPLESLFHAKSEPSEVLHGIDLSNKTVIITGGYSGIGLETTKAILKAGAKVILPCRRLDEANKNDSFLVTTEKDHLRIPKEFKSSVGIIYGKMVSNNQTDLASEIEKYI